MSISLVIHGGAGNIYPGMMNQEQEESYSQALQTALDKGYAVLKSGGEAMDSIIAAMVELENNPLFNAGRGSVFTKKGLHEMDAAVMDGRTLGAGAVSGVRNIKNPVMLAREVMLHSGHVFLSGKGAGEFALNRGIEFATDDYFFNKERYDQWIAIRDSDFYQLDHKEDNLKGVAHTGDEKFGTVGAVACDGSGNLAAATSTGGMTNKRFGRIGDSPVIGAGTYANNVSCAVSCTGHGEFFLRSVVAYDISCLIEYKGLSLAAACDLVVKDKLKKFGGEGGVIAVNGRGEHHFSFNSAGMFRGVQNENQRDVAFYT
ncbi:MAG: isoaspartyl peptidase/L-asparaginase [Sphingobacteriales bacterium]|nr:MAG: isoaspartyl peptidase/L-asparaginase [Sphingobacteriales bacterium]